MLFLLRGIVVGGVLFNLLGPYTTAIACTVSGQPGDAAGDASTICNIPVGTTNGDYIRSSDHDWFRINLTAGTAYRIHAWGGADLQITLRNASGVPLATNDNASRFTTNSIIGYVAPVTGVYYADVTGNSSSRYIIARTFAIPSAVCRAGSITGFNRDTERVGVIATKDSQVDYCFAAAQGMYMRYTIEGNPGSANPLNWPVTEVFDSTGNRLFHFLNNGGKTHLVGPIPSAGVYYLRVRPYYTITVKFPQDFRLRRSE